MNKFFLALALYNGMKPSFLKRLEERNPISDYFHLSKTALNSIGFSDALCDYIKKPPWQLVEKHIHWADSKHQTLITWHDKSYPKKLLELSSPPPFLMIKGNVKLLDTFNIAIVGSRTPTHLGANLAHKFAYQLASLGISITSGLALGIDGQAHRGALDANGLTTAILATGIDEVYPKRHHYLLDKISEKGAIISEFPLNTRPRRHHFPQRNRVISGLSDGVLVVEAKEKSGSLLTAYHALEQNINVFAIPGSVVNSEAKGCNKLIKEGAILIDSIASLCEELNIKQQLSTIETKKKQKKLDTKGKNLVKFVGYEVTSIETICSKSGLSLYDVANILIELELNGAIKAVPGGYLRLL